MALTDSLAADLTEAHLILRNGSAPSNTIGEQLWCVVGARESYAVAIQAGAWRGFSCSLAAPASPDEVRAALASAGAAARDAADVVGGDDTTRLSLLVDLVEHEVQHHGQLIRYFYANQLPFPASFAARYALD